MGTSGTDWWWSRWVQKYDVFVQRDRTGEIKVYRLTDPRCRALYEDALSDILACRLADGELEIAEMSITEPQVRLLLAAWDAEQAGL